MPKLPALLAAALAGGVGAATPALAADSMIALPDVIITAPDARVCDMALHVVTYEDGRLSVEADILIFNPQRVAAARPVPMRCSVRPLDRPLDSGAEDLRAINQATRRGSNFRNLVDAGDDRSVEFSLGGHDCKAIRHNGPRRAGGGYVFIDNISICRTDSAPVQPEDVAYVLGYLRIRAP